MSVVVGILAMGGYSWHSLSGGPWQRSSYETSAEQEMAANNERIESLFEYHPHAVYSLDLQGRFTDVNSACERMTGFSRADLRGMDSTVFSAPGDEEMARATLDDIAHRRSRVFETSIRAKDGQMLDLRITGVPIVVGDQAVGMYGIAEDVTAANKMRQELESARAAAEQATVAKTLFLANMSHELRTPLTSVLAASEMLRETDPAPEQSRLLDYIDRPGQRLLRLVEDLLDFSRIEAGNTDVDALELDLRTMVREVGDDLRFTAERKELVFDCAVDPDVPSTMVGDLARISQVLTNLLENAIKFTESGSVRLRVTNAPDSAASAVRFEVSDTGIGMSAEQVEGLIRVFQPGRSFDDPQVRRNGARTGDLQGARGFDGWRHRGDERRGRRKLLHCAAPPGTADPTGSSARARRTAGRNHWLRDGHRRSSSTTDRPHRVEAVVDLPRVTTWRQSARCPPDRGTWGTSRGVAAPARSGSGDRVRLVGPCHLVVAAGRRTPPPSGDRALARRT